MVKRVLFILAIVTGVYTSISATYSFLPDYLSGKMNKQLRKIYSKNIISQELPLIDTVIINHQLFKVQENDSFVGYSMISRAMGCKVGGCDKPKKEDAIFEEFYFMTAFDTQRKVKKVRVLEYTSNHGYQIANRGWLKQFEGQDSVGLGYNIDGISGATISVKSIINSVNNQIHLLENSL